MVLSALVCCSTGYSKEKIDGVYYDTTGLKLVVHQKRFIITDEGSGDSSPVVFAGYSWADREFIKLRNKQPVKIVKHHTKIVKTYSKTPNDSVSVQFNIPNKGKYKFSISVSCFFGYYESHIPSLPFSDIGNYDFIYTNGSESNRVNIPRKTINADIYVYIENKKPMSVDSLIGNYNGFGAYNIKPIRIGKKLSSIDIELRGLDEFFGRQYVNGDYVRVVGDRLYWRGRVFEKSYAPEDIRYIEEKESALKK